MSESDSEFILDGYFSLFDVIESTTYGMLCEVVSAAIASLNRELEANNQPIIKLKWRDIPYDLMREWETFLFYYDVTQWKPRDDECHNTVMALLKDRIWKLRDIVTEWLKNLNPRNLDETPERNEQN